MSEFHSQRTNKDGLRYRCKKCRSPKQKEWSNSDKGKAYREMWRAENPDYKVSYDLKRKFGITLGQYNEKKASQDGRCAICGDIPSQLRGGKIVRLSVDHDHATGEVRGLLCNKCNRGIGYLQDSVDILQLAAEYLSKYATKKAQS